jgi:hypothetical protein
LRRAAIQSRNAALASTTSPQTSRAARTPATAASAPPSRMPTGCTTRELIDQQASTRDRTPSAVTVIR